jgi:hypothetical protein
MQISGNKLNMNTGIQAILGIKAYLTEPSCHIFPVNTLLKS